MQDSYQRTPLHYATESTRVQTIDILRAYGIGLDVPDTLGRTAILPAAAEGTVEAFEHLLHLEGDQQLVSLDNEGKNAFHLASENFNSPIVKYIETHCGSILRTPPKFINTDKSNTHSAIPALVHKHSLFALCCGLLVFYWRLVCQSPDNVSACSGSRKAPA